MCGRDGRHDWLVFAGDPVRTVGRIRSGVFGTGLYGLTAIVPDGPDGAMPCMSYGDGPVLFRGGYADSFDEAVNLITRQATGLVGADANLRCSWECVADR